MECQELERSELATRYLNWQLDPATQEQVELHILECRSCQRRLELLQTIRDDVRAHAHEIWAYSADPRGYLRWAWIAITGFLVVAGGICVRQVLVPQQGYGPVAQNVPPEIPGPPAQSPSANAGVASPSRTNSRMRVGAENQGRVPAGLFRIPKESAAGIETQPTKTTDNEPSKGRDQLNYSNGNPNLHHSMQAVRRSETVGQATAEAKPEKKPVVPSAPEPASSFDSVDQIAKLARVRPLPCTFAGMAGSSPSGGGSAGARRQAESAFSENPSDGLTRGATAFSSAEDYFRQGMSAYAGRQYETAVNLLTHAVMLEPEFSEANLYLGICQLLRGSPSEAASALQIAAKEKKPALAQAAHFFLAKAYLQLGKLAEAESELGVAAALPGCLAGKSKEILQKLDDICSQSGRK